MLTTTNWPLPRNHTTARHLLLRWVASAANIRHPIQPTEHRGGASTRCWNNHAQPPGVRNQPDHLKKKHETYLPQRPKTTRKMDPVLAGQPSVHVNTFEQWFANMAPNSRQCAMLRKYMHNAAEGSATAETAKYKPKESELSVVAPELTSELLHCLSTLPDPWPLAKITINMDSASQWVSRMCRLFFADEYARHTVRAMS